MLVLPTPVIFLHYSSPNCFDSLFTFFVLSNLLSFKKVSSTASSLNLQVTLRHDLQTEENLQQINIDIWILFLIICNSLGFVMVLHYSVAMLSSNPGSLIPFLLLLLLLLQ